MVELVHVTYNGIHNLIKNATKEIAKFEPELLIAIGMLLPWDTVPASS